MSNITAEMIMELRKTNETLKSQVDQAKGKVTVIQEQIADAVESLAKNGVTPDTAQQRINELNEESLSLYQNIKQLQGEIRNECKR